MAAVGADAVVIGVQDGRPSGTAWVPPAPARETFGTSDQGKLGEIGVITRHLSAEAYSVAHVYCTVHFLTLPSTEVDCGSSGSQSTGAWLQ